MHTTTINIGSSALNASFILYLLVYLPQIMHNRCKKNLANLSNGMHFSLFCGYFVDLCYGFCKHLPWQYKTVSIVGVILLVIQHVQIIIHRKQEKNFYALIFNILVLVAAAFFAGTFFIKLHGRLSADTTIILGYVARFFFLIYLIPQLIKNKYQSTTAVSPHMIYLSLILCVCDGISAWCLDWGWPNKIAMPFTLTLLLMLLRQQKNAEKHLITKIIKL